MRDIAPSRVSPATTALSAILLALLSTLGFAAPVFAAGTGSISGTVTVPAGVDATKIHISANGTSFKTTTVASNGTYSISDLMPGDYSLFFSYMGDPSPIVRTYYGPSPRTATPVTVAAETSTAGINQTLQSAAIVSGKIDVPAGSQPYQGSVYLAPQDSSSSAGLYAESDYLNASDAGNFAVGGLLPGTYKVQYQPYSGPWATMWHGGVPSAASSPLITLTAGQRLDGISDQAVLAATISGSVSGGEGNLRSVMAVAADGTVIAQTTADGTTNAYSLQNLFPGTYKVQFNRASGFATTAEAQFYNNLPESRGLASGNSIAAPGGQQLTGINANLRPGGTLSGKITGADGSPLNNVPVRVYTKDGSLVTRGTNTGTDGTFQVTGLTTGQYIVAANMLSTRPTAGLGQIYSGNVRTESAATPVATTAGQNVDIGTLSYGTTGGPTFSDVPAGTQFHAEISWLAQKGISTGWTEPNGTTTYRPLQPVNRDAMAAFMYRLAGKPAFTPPTVSPFSDVPNGAQFYKEITWLATQGISTGWTEADGTKTYRPLQPVNRDAMAAFMYRFAGKPAFSAPTATPFQDVPASSQFYKEITWLAAQGISTGWTEGDGSKTYRPLQSVNRDAMAAFMYRYNTKFGSL